MSGEHSLQWLERLKDDCLQLERDRGLRPKLVQELERYLTDFVSKVTADWVPCGVC